ncbi:MAG: VIT1/CCC1 transporter family protein [Chloroflexi bacterium]|nr:VIT1/CCC1 transporter family protein [Chloroflexota bacterium]
MTTQASPVQTDGTPHQSERQSIWRKIRDSFYASVGDIVFGMEDGTVSIFGLVFGVAASSTSTAPVVLAGATGAISAAVSMMAGVFLDVESQQGQANAELSAIKARIDEHPAEELARIRSQLTGEGFTPAEAETIVSALQRDPKLLLRFEINEELQIGTTAKQSPLGHALWMFASDLLAASIPVIPFAIWSLGTARVVSVIITTALLVLLGIGRARIAHTPVLRTIAETVGIAAAAAVAGLLIGLLVDRWTGS